MAAIRPHEPVKLFCAILSIHPDLLQQGEAILQERFGAIDVRSAQEKFPDTDYYAREMGQQLVKRLVAFRQFIQPEDLAAIKCQTNEWEEKYRALHPNATQRALNFDPGFLNLSQVILASTKGSSHRIALPQGIFAEITLTYNRKAKRYLPLPWTYPDYASGVYDDFFGQARELLRQAAARS